MKAFFNKSQFRIFEQKTFKIKFQIHRRTCQIGGDITLQDCIFNQNIILEIKKTRSFYLLALLSSVIIRFD